MGGVVLGILVWQEGGDYVVLLIAIGALALWALARWLVRRHRDGKVTVLDPDLFRLPHFRVGVTGEALQNVTLGGGDDRAAIFLQIKLEYGRPADGPLARSALTDHVRRRESSPDVSPASAGPAKIIRAGFALSALGLALILPIVPRAHSGWYLVIPLAIAGAGARSARVAAEQLHLGPNRRGTNQRGCRGELGGGVVRVVVWPGGGPAAFFSRPSLWHSPT